MSRRRQLTLIVLCLGALMIDIDGTVVNIALPSIQRDFGLSQPSLVWVMDAYLVTFGGCLILSGRLGDLFGYRRVLLTGLALFTVASLACGLAWSGAFLILARVAQGVGGAVVAALTLSAIMDLYEDAPARAKAMGTYAFIGTGGGSLGLVVGGALTHSLGWHWIFLVNIPIGASIFFLCRRLLPPGVRRPMRRVVPLELFRVGNVLVANIASLLFAGSVYGWAFTGTLYLQVVLGYDPLEVGLIFLPASLITAALSIWASPALVAAFGSRKPVVAGLLLSAAALLLLARAPSEAGFAVAVMSAMLLFGVGNGIAYSPLMLNALEGVAADEVGAASGLLNTSFVVGGALGLYTLSVINGGYPVAFALSAVFSVVAAALIASVGLFSATLRADRGWP